MMSPESTSTRTGSATAGPVSFYEGERPVHAIPVHAIPVHAITGLVARTLPMPQPASSDEVAAEINRLFRDVCDHCTNGRWAQVDAACDALISLRYATEFVIEAKARACHDLGKWEEYLTVCLSLLKINPGKLEYLQGTIRGCMNTHRYLEAIGYSTRLREAAITNEVKKWALEKRAHACSMQAQADAELIAGLHLPAAEAHVIGTSPVVLPHSP
ncbi:MAG: hypothetical protein LLG04_08050 [Parachlamydia sp.]|nr:hypothetical protein [Parachlamydia sp.]